MNVAVWDSTTPSTVTASQPMDQLPTGTVAAALGRPIALLIAMTWASGLVLGFQTSLGVLTAVGFAAAVMGIRWPVLGLYGIGLLCVIDSLTRAYLMTGGLLRWNTFNYLLIAVAVYCCPLLLRNRNPSLLLLECFVGVLLAQIIYSPGMEAGVLHSLNVVSALGLFVYVYRVRNDADAWYWLGIICGVTAAYGGLIYYLQKSSLPEVDHSSLATLPNTAILITCLALWFARRCGYSQWPLLLLALANFCWTFLSGSRASLLATLPSLVFLMRQIQGQGRRSLFILAAPVFVLLILTQFDDLRERTVGRMVKLADGSKTLTSRTSGRFDLALGSWYIFLDHPLGIGTGGFPHAWAQLDQREGLSGFKRGREMWAHNAWLRTLSENGFPGFLCFAGFVFSFAIIGYRRRKHGVWGIGLLATVTLSWVFLNAEFTAKGIWLFTVAAAVLLSRGYASGGSHIVSRDLYSPWNGLQ